MRRLPAEWEHQAAVLLTWPNRNADWWDHNRTQANDCFATIASQISRHQSVIINCLDADHQAEIEQLLKKQSAQLSSIHFYQLASNDVWARDHGPITICVGQQRSMLNFTFNGWGNKYPATDDNKLTQALHQRGAFANSQLENHELILEGGSIDCNGDGVLLTTESCLLSRNENLSKHEFETLFANLFGIHTVHWLSHGHLAGDDTDGHIDTLARFVNRDTICYVSCHDHTDEHYDSLKAMELELENLNNDSQSHYQLVPLPFPAAIYSAVDGRRLPATYANFLIINNAVLLPVYHDPADELAHHILQSCFPTHEIIDIDARPLIENYGSIHCVTMQIPDCRES